MAGPDYAEWLQRGRVHMWEGRPIDAVLCFRRAAQADARGADARFHLGEMLWQLGLSDEAVAAWRDAARTDVRFLAARLAVAEALLSRGDYAGAMVSAREALAIAPTEFRAQASHAAAAAALGDHAALEALAKLLSQNPDFAKLPAYAAALARVLEHAPRDALREDLVAELLPRAAEMPSAVLAPVVSDAFARDPTPLIEVLRTRTWQRGEVDALRRIIVAVQPQEAALARELAATHAAMCVAEPLLVPSLWPVRTGGAALRLAWLMPAPDGPAFAFGCAAVRETLRDLAGTEVALTIVCTGNADATRAGLPVLPSDAVFLPLPPAPDATHARALAASGDPDALVDMAGLNAATGLFLAARPARNVWSLAKVAPGHAPALVERVFATTGELANSLRELRDGASSDSPGARELAEWWDVAVRAHQQHDTAAAATGYARVLAVQPDYAPAHRLLAVLARDRGDTETAEHEFARAIALAPDDADTRIAAAQLEIATHHADAAATSLREGLDRTPYRVSLWHALGQAELARRDGAAAAWAFSQALRLAPADGRTYFNLGVAMQMTGDVDEAVQAYQRALVLQPDFASACFNLGVLFQQQERVDAAIAAYRQALALNPRDATAYKNLGEVLYAVGAESTRGSRIFARSKRTVLPRCRSRSRRSRSASLPATTRGWIATSTDCARRSFRRTTNWNWSMRWRSFCSCCSISTSSPKCCTGSRPRTTPPQRTSMARRDRGRSRAGRAGSVWAICPATCATTSWASRCGRPSSTTTARDSSSTSIRRPRRATLGRRNSKASPSASTLSRALATPRPPRRSRATTWTCWSTCRRTRRARVRESSRTSLRACRSPTSPAAAPWD